MCEKIVAMAGLPWPVDMKFPIHIHIHTHRFCVDIYGYIHIHICLSWIQGGLQNKSQTFIHIFAKY